MCIFFLIYIVNFDNDIKLILYLEKMSVKQRNY